MCLGARSRRRRDVTGERGGVQPCLNFDGGDGRGIIAADGDSGLGSRRGLTFE